MEFLSIFAGLHAVGKRRYHINHGKPPFVFTEYFSDFSALEQGYFCGGHIEFFSHPYVRNLERPPVQVHEHN